MPSLESFDAIFKSSIHHSEEQVGVFLSASSYVNGDIFTAFSESFITSYLSILLASDFIAGQTFCTLHDLRVSEDHRCSTPFPAGSLAPFC